jgi:chemotaxis protein CheZ
LQPKVFRIEQWAANGDAPAAPGLDHAEAQLRHYELMGELQTLRYLLEHRGPSKPATPTGETHRAEMAEFQRLKEEIAIVYQSINRTKQEIATLHLTGFDGEATARVTRELGAVVGGTEHAALQILNAAEQIDQTANTLGATLKDVHQQRLSEIQDHVMRIFEACSFQDLAGQRISKVLATLRFIETHILRMMEIWGGLDAFKEFAPEATAHRQSDTHLVNGPKLDDDQGHISQDDVDALFRASRKTAGS